MLLAIGTTNHQICSRSSIQDNKKKD